MDPGTGQNRPLVLSIFVLALLLTIQAQIKERGRQMARATITQILAVATQFGDNLNKYEEENKKLKSGRLTVRLRLITKRN